MLVGDYQRVNTMLIDDSPRVDDFLNGLSSEVSRVILPSLVALEVDYRMLRGESPTSAEYLTRYSELDADWLEQICYETNGCDPTLPTSGESSGPKLAAG